MIVKKDDLSVYKSLSIIMIILEIFDLFYDQMPSTGWKFQTGNLQQMHHAFLSYAKKRRETGRTGLTMESGREINLRGEKSDRTSMNVRDAFLIHRALS